MLRPSFLAVLALLALPGAAHAATITVNDGGDVNASDGKCTLREAVRSASTATAVGGCAKGDGGDTIAVAVPKVTLALAGASEDAGLTGDLDVTGTMTIRPASGTATIDAAHLDRVFDVAVSGSLTLQDLTVTGGRAPAGANATPTATAGEPGGGIRSAGALALQRVTVTGNASGAGGNGTGTYPFDTGIHGINGGTGGDGGGVLSTGSLDVRASTISDNATGAGGSGDSAFGTTGALDAEGGSGGYAGNGGGLAVSGPSRIADSTISGNTTGAGGAGAGTLAASGAAATGGSPAGDGGSGYGGTGGDGGDGGGVMARLPGPVTIIGSLIAGNATAPGAAGGDGRGGAGGSGLATNVKGGDGGWGDSGSGGRGGSGGGLLAQGYLMQGTPAMTLAASTVTQNTTGGGGAGGRGYGGPGGRGGVSAAGGDGGPELDQEHNANTGAGGGVDEQRNDALVVTGATIVANAASRTLAPRVHGAPGGGGFGAPDGADGTVMSVSPAQIFGGSGMYSDSPRINLSSSIVALNADDQCGASSNPASRAGHHVANLTYPSSPGNDCPGATLGTPTLRPLGDYGGATRTMPPLPGSPALDLVAPGADCGAVPDQRGVPRPFGAGCDAGAYEVAAPGLAASASPAGVVSGAVDARRGTTTVHVEYGTTAAHGARTADVVVPAGTDAATPVTFALPGLAAGTTYHYILVGTALDGAAQTGDATFTTAGAGGGGAVGPAPGTTTPTRAPRVSAPVIAKLRLSPASFRHGKSTTITWTDSAAATVTFTIQRKASGVRKGKACAAKPRKKAKARAKSCTRWLTVKGSFTHVDKAGANTYKWNGKLGGRKVAAGSYRLAATPRLAGAAAGKVTTKAFIIRR